jgi:hypothetical protein
VPMVKPDAASGRIAEFSSEEAPWDLRFTREFKEQLFALHRQPTVLTSLLDNLRRLAHGERSRALRKQLKGVPKSLRIFESPVKTWNDGGRFLWEYSVDYSPRICGYSDCIRLWRLCLQHDDVPKGIDWIVSSHKRGRTSTMKKGLKSCTQGSTLMPDGVRVPRQYSVEEGADMQELVSQDRIRFELLTEDGEDDDPEEFVEHEFLFTPPAVSNANSFNVLKFYQLNDEVLHSLRAFRPHAPQPMPHASADSMVPADGTASPEFPFIPDDRLVH